MKDFEPGTWLRVAVGEPSGSGTFAQVKEPEVAEPAKLAARLQAASASGRPVLLRVEEHGGHGAGSTREQEHALLADVLAFLLHAFEASR
ncbi:prolyl oligopeptidase family serine peptidase [Nonomuraea sp. H19]|uniref:prolyl oligopeptidase family serine peptidase n=1 Tax=Nonomuraea sp. H19 TaxID=3452206 RepID=UPI003F88CA3A